MIRPWSQIIDFYQSYAGDHDSMYEIAALRDPSTRVVSNRQSFHACDS